MDKPEIAVPSYPGVTVHPGRWAAYRLAQARDAEWAAREEERAVREEEQALLAKRGFRFRPGW